MRRWPLLVALLLWPSAARAFDQAIVIGANSSVDRELAPLRYADDDAIRFAELFQAVGMHTRILTRLDEDTRRLHPEVVDLVQPPTAAALRAAVKDLAAEATAARKRGEETSLYVVFAGHGNQRRDRAYLTLEDERLYPDDLLRVVVTPVDAARTHVIIDACHSYLFAMSRGPGGTHRPVSGFVEESVSAAARNVGFLVSSSQSGESHEWEAFQAGVFSHEVRSGLTGAADADGDGTVSYREMAAFVLRANAAIVNEHYRPAVYARAPLGHDTLIDLRAAPLERLRIDGRAAGKHLLIEDARGVRWADLHPRQGEVARVVLPARRPLYVRSLEDGQESELPPGRETVLADVPWRPSAAGSRGAAQHVFQSLFTLPFDRAAVDALELQTEDDDERRPASRWRARHTLGVVALGVAGAAAAGATAYLVAGHNLHSSTDPSADQQAAAGRDAQIGRDNRNAGLLYGAAAAAATTGLLLLLWPTSETSLTLRPDGAQVSFTWHR